MVSAGVGPVIFDEGGRRMSRVVVIHNVTLDGVDQAPGRADEDLRDGFVHGGWAVPYSDDAMGRVMASRMGQQSALLLGRRTYQDFASYWPRQQGNPYTDVLELMTKYVASRTLEGPLPWGNSVLLKDAVPEAAALKRDLTGSLVVLGSAELVRALAAAGLVDEYVLLIHPLTLGAGRRLFAEGATPASLQLVNSTPTSTGVVIATFRPIPVGAEPGEVGREAVPAQH
jgi:dihydrofolate reductase